MVQTILRELTEGEEGSGILGTTKGDPLPKDVGSSQLYLVPRKRGGIEAGDARGSSTTAEVPGTGLDSSYVGDGDPFDAAAGNVAGDGGDFGSSSTSSATSDSADNSANSHHSSDASGVQQLGPPGDVSGGTAGVLSRWVGSESSFQLDQSKPRGGRLGDGEWPSWPLSDTSHVVRSLPSFLVEAGVSQDVVLSYQHWFISLLIDSVCVNGSFNHSGLSFVWKPEELSALTFAIWKDDELVRGLELSDCNDDHEFQVRSRDKKKLRASIDQLLSSEPQSRIKEEKEHGSECDRIQSVLEDIWSKRTASGGDGRTPDKTATEEDGKTSESQTATGGDGRTPDGKQTASDRAARTQGKAHRGRR